MKRNLWRMLMALVISSSGFIGTVIWFQMGKGEMVRGDHKPIARLGDSSNEVQRKPIKRVIWESVGKNDDLFTGEAVRTAPNAEAQLFFIKSGTVVHLDPDSLVVLEETDKGMSLDFLQGNLFVQSTNSQAGDGLTLKTGNGEIHLKSADMSLSKNANGKVALEVHRGEAELDQGSKKTELNKDKSAEISESGVQLASDRMEILRPVAGETLFLNLTRGEKLDLGWKALPPGYTVGVEVGTVRSALSKVTGTMGAGEKGQLNLAAKPGRWYLRLVATSADGKLPALASSVIPVIVQPKSPPALIEPQKDASVIHTEPKSPTAFKWLNRNKFSSQVLEIASDAAFKNSKVRQNLYGDVMTYSAEDLADGVYFWRVTGFLKIKGKSESLSSTAEKFTLSSKWELKAPTLIYPTAEQHLSLIDVQKFGLTVKWQTPQNVEKVKAKIEHKEGGIWAVLQETESETSASRLSDVKPGKYRFTAVSLDDHGGSSPAAIYHEFTVEEMPKIDWGELTQDTTYRFRTPTPTLASHWKALPTTPYSYRYRATSTDEDATPGEWHNTKQNSFEMPVAREGNYRVTLEAVDAKGQLVGQSDTRTITVEREPLLPAPQWAATTPKVLKADGKGNLSFAWDEVEGAKRYLMILETPDGKTLQEKEISRTTASINKLKPGAYKVYLRSVDDFKRPSLDGLKRSVEVPQTSDIRAPRIKAMKVK